MGLVQSKNQEPSFISICKSQSVAIAARWICMSGLAPACSEKRLVETTLEGKVEEFCGDTNREGRRGNFCSNVSREDSHLCK